MLRSQNLLVEGLVIIHGAALTLFEFQEMQAKKVGLPVTTPTIHPECCAHHVCTQVDTRSDRRVALEARMADAGFSGSVCERQATC